MPFSIFRDRHVGRAIVLQAATVLLSVLFIILGNRIASKEAVLFSDSDQRIVALARVSDVINRTTTSVDLGGVEHESAIIAFRATISGGRYKGTSVSVTQYNEPTHPVQLRDVKEGDHVLITLVDYGEIGYRWLLLEYDRTRPLLVLGAAFVLFSVIFGRQKGVNTILSLTLTCLSIFFVFIPSILSGHNIYILTYIICLFITVMTLALVNGFNQKSLAAGVGCLSGLMFSGLLFWLMDHFLMLSGYVTEESVFLMGLDTPEPIDLKAIIFASIIIGALGATMDVAVSIASSLSEIDEVSGGASYAGIIKSGIAIGRDIMGTMANTLILAYVGSSLSILLLIIVYANSVVELFNREMVVVEILQSLTGSLGLMITIPLTSVVYANLVRLRAGGHSKHPADSDS